MADFVEPAIHKEITAGGRKDILVEDVRHRHKHHCKAHHHVYSYAEYGPAEHFEMVPKGHPAFFFLFVVVMLVFG